MTTTVISPGSSEGSPASNTGETGKETGLKDGISFREAGIKLGISDKTLRARIREGAVEGWTVEGKRGLEWRVRLPDAEEHVRQDDHAPVSEGRDIDAHVQHGGRDEARPPEREGRDRDRDGYRDQLERQAAEITFLREQLSARTTAEEQLRVLLMQLERTNAELAASLCQKALPPAVEVGETPKAKVRWYWPWRRV